MDEAKDESVANERESALSIHRGGSSFFFQEMLTLELSPVSLSVL